MSLNSYDYNEQVRLVPRNFNVTISDDDKVISIEEDGALVAVLSLNLEGEILKLIGKDNMEISSVELPKAETLERAYYDKDTYEIVMVIRMGDGTINELRVDVKELVDVYQEGNGIMIDEENKIHVKINKLSENILSATEEGLGINLSDYATEADIQEEARLREKYDDQLREDLKEEARIREEEDDAQWESIHKLEDNSASVENETKRALEAEANLQTNINAETNERRIDVENLQTNINVETNERRIDVANLQGNINALSEKIDSIDSVSHEELDAVSKAIEEETQNRVADVENLRSLISEEASARSAEDVKLQSDIATVNTNLVEAINNINKNMADGFNTINGGIENEIKPSIAEETRLREEADVKLQEAIDALGSGSTETIENEIKERKEADTKLNEAIATVNTNLVDAVNAINQNVADGFNTINGGIENEIKPSIEEEKRVREETDSKLQSDIATVNSNLVEAINNINKNMADGFNTINGGIENEIKPSIVEESRVREEADAKLQEAIDALGSGSTEIIENEIKERKEADAKLNEAIATVNTNLVDAVNAINQNVADGFNTINGGIENEIKPSIAEKVPFTKVTKDGVEYQVIVLGNHANLLGYGAEGNNTYNLAMVSKWNKADFGSAQLEINLNGSAERPTYNDTKELALLEDVDNVLKGSISLVKKSDLEYTLMVDGVDCGTITLPKDQFLKDVSYDGETNILKFVFDTTDGEKTTDIDMSDLVDTYVAGNGLMLESNTFSINIDANTQRYIEVSAEGLKIVGVNEALSTKVDLVDISTEDNPNRKAIVLKNHDMLLGTNTSGSTANIAMINKWDIVDLGTSSLPINLNTPSGVRPTVQEAGQTGEEANKIAYLSDVENFKTEIDNVVNGINDDIIDINNRIDEINGNVDNINNDVDGINGKIDEISNEIEEIKNSTVEGLDKKVDWTDISTDGNPERKAIVLKNNDMLLGTNTSGSTANIAMINKWDIVDLGTSSLKINLNTPKDERPTVQEAGQTGEEAHKIAYLSDVDKFIGTEEFSSSSEMSLYGLKKYVDESVNSVDAGIDGEIARIDSKFDSYVTKEAHVNDLNTLKDEINSSVDTKVSGIKDEAVVEAVNQSNTYTDSKVQQANTDIASVADRVTLVEGRCDHYDDLFGMILEEHQDDPVNLKFYTKDETDAKFAEVNAQIEGVSSELGTFKEETAQNFENVNTDISELADTVGVIDDNVEALTQSVEAVKVDVEGVKDNVETLTQSVETVKNDVDAVKADVESVKQSVEDAKAELNGKIDEVKVEVDKKVELVDVSDEENPGRKAILLNNHDIILGKSTDGTPYALAMVSKWDKADFGTASLPINLNGNAERPTYNDDKEIALLDDVNNVLNGSISLVKNSDLEYTLMVNEVACGTISIPKDQFLKNVSYNGETKVLTFVFDTTNGEQSTSIDMSDLVDTYIAGNGLNLTSNEFSIKIDANTQHYIEVGAEGLKIVGIDEKLATKVDLVDISTEDNPNRKAVVLKNHDMLLGTNTSGTTANIAMINKWDVVDLGTSSLKINLNTPKDERPTVQEAGQTGEEAHKIAYVSDVENVSNALAEAKTEIEATIAEVSEKVDAVEEKLNTKVDLTDVSDEENPGRKAIVLNNHDVILGKSTDGTAYALAMVSKWDKADFGAASLPINLNGNAERPTYNDNEELALLKDVEEIKEPIAFNFPIRTLQDKVYTQEEIFGWFGVADAVELKNLIVREGQFYLKFGIQLSGNPYDYKMPIQYIAFETANQIKMVVIGLDTSNDMPTKYEIIINLDGTVAEGNSNIKVTSKEIALLEDTKNGVTFLGNFTNSTQAENKAVEYAKNYGDCILTYTVNDTYNGVIINSVKQDHSCKQRLYLDGKYFVRTISTDGVAGSWTEIPDEFSNKITNSKVNMYALSRLTSSATNEQIVANMSNITEDVLNKCLAEGKVLLEMASQTTVTVGWTGSNWILSSIGNFNSPWLAFVILNYTDGQWSIVNSYSGEIITKYTQEYVDLKAQVVDLLARIEALEGNQGN